jgi:hypothetical protein
MLLGILFKGQNLAYMVGLAFALAACANFKPLSSQERGLERGYILFIELTLFYERQSLLDSIPSLRLGTRDEETR